MSAKSKYEKTKSIVFFAGVVRSQYRLRTYSAENELPYDGVAI
jgi:hypothetical protein